MSEVKHLKPLDAETALASGEDWNREIGRWRSLIKSGALPKHIRTPEMAIAITRMGNVYGWDSMRSLRSIFLVDGRPEMSAESMLSLIREKCPEATLVPVEMTANRVAIKVTRPPQMPEPVVFEVTIDQFQHLLKKDNWRYYRPDMLWARGISRIARRVFPDVTAGAYTRGEIEEANLTVTQVPSDTDVEADLFSDPSPTEQIEDAEIEPEEFDDRTPIVDDWADTDAIDGPPEDDEP